MLDTLRDLLAHQYDAALCTLHHTIARCPDAEWDRPVARLKFCQAAFHTVFFTDFYLQPTDELGAFQSQPFHLAHPADFRDYEEFTDRPQTLLYSRAFALAYLQHVREKAGDTIARETADTLTGPSGFARRPCSRAELHVYNLRHVQHHAAQLSLRLRLDAGVEIPWVSHAWKEA